MGIVQDSSNHPKDALYRYPRVSSLHLQPIPGNHFIVFFSYNIILSFQLALTRDLNAAEEHEDLYLFYAQLVIAVHHDVTQERAMERHPFA